MFETPLTYEECAELILNNFTNPIYNYYYPDYIIVKYIIYILLVMILMAVIYKSKNLVQHLKRKND